MTLKTVPLSSLLPPKDNPRHTFDQSLIASLAKSIRTDGVLQNLVVVPEGSKFRVLSGKRRYLALQHLKKEKAITPAYRVPIAIKRDLGDADSVRVATVENVHREPLHPMDEAEAWASQLSAGGTIETIVEATGLSAQTIKRRLALASLCPAAKEALYAGTISLGIAEALTLGAESQQKAIVDNVTRGYPIDADEIRAMFLDGKPTVQMAIFPKERYSGTFTADLFATEETTYFDDTEQFFELQKEAVDRLADEHRANAAWVEVLNLYSVPWWQYRRAKKRERGGVVINLHPSGTIEVREGLVKEAVKEEVVTATREASEPKERPAFSAALLRHMAHHQSAAVQAALLGNPRKAKELVACLVFLGTRPDGPISLRPHPCLSDLRQKQPDIRAFRKVEAVAATLADLLGIAAADNGSRPKDGVERLLLGDPSPSLWEAVGRLSDEDIDRLLSLVPILCFGREGGDDAADNLFAHVAAALGLNMREWWTPETMFLSSLRREQLIGIVRECNLAGHFVGIDSWSKTEIVEALARVFASTSADTKVRAWLPEPMRFGHDATYKAAS